MADNIVQPASVELRPMSIGDILDATFRLYRARFVPFLTIALVAYVPYALIIAFLNLGQGSARGFPLQAEGNGFGGADVNPLTILASVGGALLFFLVVWPLCQGALIHNISAGYLGENLSAMESYSRSASRVVKLLGSQVLVGLAVMGGLILLIVPGIIFSLWFMLVPAIVMLENLSGSAALKRSRELMRGNVGKGIALLLVVSLLGGLIGAVLGGIIGFVFQRGFLFHFLLNTLQGVIVPLQITPLILLYYDLRIRKEAFDLQQLAAGLGH